MNIVLNGTVTHWCNVLTDIRIAKETGYAGIELIGEKLYRMLELGLDIAVVKEALDGFPAISVGFIPDIERSEPTQYAALLAETDRMCSVAGQLGCPNVQILTGPHLPDGEYKGHPGMPMRELIKLTAKNLREMCKIARTHGVTFYLEPINWAPISSLDDSLTVINETGEDNVGLVVDFWHMLCTGATPEDIAKIDRRLINGVHVCDSSEPRGVRSPDNTQPSRQVWTGGGQIPLKEWVDAVNSTGYDGWWSPELFSEKHWELDPWQTAANLRQMMSYLLY